MFRRIKQTVAAIAALAALALGGSALAGAAGNSDSGDAGDRGGRPHETALTGTTATKVKQAALAKLPGATILRVETDDGGVYEAHVRKTDGTEVEVKVNKDFEVTAVEEHGPGGPGGHRGPGGPGGPPNEEPLTGTTADKVRAAVLAKLPGATILRLETDDGGVYEAHVRKSDGTEVEVKVNTAFEVTAVEEHRRP